MIYELKKYIKNEEFDYLLLLSFLKNYKYPRDKIKNLLQKQKIIRIKKGLYIFNAQYRDRPFSREILANMIYGPSYISSEYALSYYGLIPERVEVLTSVTLQYKKVFQTPVGTFVYYTIPKKVYAYGIDWIEIEKNRFVLMADMEKALLDKIYLDRGIYFHSLKDVELYLFENLRVDENLFFSLKRKKLDLYIQKYQSKKLELIFKFFLSKKDGK